MARDLQEVGRQASHRVRGAAIEEAICFGWIDSKSKAVDDERTSLYFAPRRPKSNWTEGNIARFETLEAAGLMTDAGREAFNRGS